MIHLQSLKNGVRVLSERVATTETISLGFWFLSGSRDENSSERGFSHFLEHMLFKGTERRTAFQIARDIDRVGGILNAYTDKELCCYYCTVPKDSLELSIDILKDMIFHSVFDLKEIENEKGVVINEILSIQDAPEELSHELFLKKFYEENPVVHTVTGEVTDIQRITRDSLVEFYGKKYTVSNLIISIVGNFEENRLLDAMASVGELAASPHTPNNRIRPVFTHDFSYVKSPFTQVQVYTGMDCPEIADEKHFYAGLVMSTLFGESMSSRLFQKVREELGLCYAINSYRAFYSDTATFNIYANTKPETLAPLVQAVNGELRRLCREPVGKGEIEDAKSHILGSILLSKEDMEIRMKRIFKLYLIFNKLFDFDESTALIRTVTESDVNGLIARILRPGRFNLLAYGKIKKQDTRMKGFDF